ncbi:MAG TPA: winged helix-turn-helix transcriptional regulator, partial [Solirubrobacterales bacterium]|nr:winged helix-turn-helix transcriptional regulator [Solirubrobacterales bacterium]
MPGAGDPVADRLRAGGRALLVLADPASVSILRQLARGPLESTELLGRVDYVSRSTYFERMRDLEELSLISRKRRVDVPPVTECRLAANGQRLLPVAALLDEWLGSAPQGPLKLGEAYATAAVKALAIGWGSTLLRWLAERPYSLTELEQAVDGLGYRKLERTVRDLAQAGLAERVAVRSRLCPYRVTPWGRRAAGPLTAAIRWERNAIPGRSALVTSVEAEGVLLLALPLVELPAGVNGTCILLVDADPSGAESLGGAVVRLMDGRPISWAPTAALGSAADCWVRGTASAWLDAGS